MDAIENETKPKTRVKRDELPVVSIIEQIASCPKCGGQTLKHLHGEIQENGSFAVRDKQCLACGCKFIVFVDIEFI